MFVLCVHIEELMIPLNGRHHLHNHSRLNAAQDATRKQVSVGDIVDIAAGRVKGKSGTVKFIHRQGLFLHVR